MFKQNLRYLWLLETINYGISPAALPELEVYARRWKSAEARTITTG
jgi:hypothetical protein